MSEKITQKHCKTCEKKVLAKKNGPNHILHLILSIFTAGIWLVIWLAVSLLQEPWRCSQCGQRLQL